MANKRERRALLTLSTTENLQSCVWNGQRANCFWNFETWRLREDFGFAFVKLEFKLVLVFF